MRFQIGDIVIVNKDKKRDLWKIERFHLINPRIVRLKGLTNGSIIVDPAILAMIVASIPSLTNIDVLEAVSYTRAGTDGFGGIETQGTLKKAIPNKGYVPPVEEQPSKNDEGTRSYKREKSYKFSCR